MRQPATRPTACSGRAAASSWPTTTAATTSAGSAPDGASECLSWSRRSGPFLRDGGFRIHVLHCFWTFPTIEEAGEVLAEAFGEQGAAVSATLRRPRLSWNVAIYHRSRRPT